MDWTCPKCGLISPPSAHICDCGFDRLAPQPEPPAPLAVIRELPLSTDIVLPSNDRALHFSALFAAGSVVLFVASLFQDAFYEIGPEGPRAMRKRPCTPADRLDRGVTRRACLVGKSDDSIYLDLHGSWLAAARDRIRGPLVDIHLELSPLRKGGNRLRNWVLAVGWKYRPSVCGKHCSLLRSTRGSRCFSQS